jgi:hypothetical protein
MPRQVYFFHAPIVDCGTCVGPDKVVTIMSREHAVLYTTLQTCILVQLYLTYPVFSTRNGGYSAQRRIQCAAEDMDFHILRSGGYGFPYPPLRTGAGSRPGEGGQEQVDSRQAEEPDTASAGQVRVRAEQEQGGSQGAAAGQRADHVHGGDGLPLGVLSVGDR